MATYSYLEFEATLHKNWTNEGEVVTKSSSNTKQEMWGCVEYIIICERLFLLTYQIYDILI